MKNIWISGSINSGKSTVSKILGKKLKMAVIELDSFSEFIDQFMDFNDYIKLNYDIAPEIALTNRGERELNDWERGRIIHNYENGVNNLSFGFRVDTKNLTLEETANEIVSLLKKNHLTNLKVD